MYKVYIPSLSFSRICIELWVFCTVVNVDIDAVMIGLIDSFIIMMTRPLILHNFQLILVVIDHTQYCKDHCIQYVNTNPNKAGNDKFPSVVSCAIVIDSIHAS